MSESKKLTIAQAAKVFGLSYFSFVSRLKNDKTYPQIKRDELGMFYLEESEVLPLAKKEKDFLATHIRLEAASKLLLGDSQRLKQILRKDGWSKDSIFKIKYFHHRPYVNRQFFFSFYQKMCDSKPLVKISELKDHFGLNTNEFYQLLEYLNFYKKVRFVRLVHNGIKFYNAKDIDSFLLENGYKPLKN